MFLEAAAPSPVCRPTLRLVEMPRNTDACPAQDSLRGNALGAAYEGVEQLQPPCRI